MKTKTPANTQKRPAKAEAKVSKSKKNKKNTRLTTTKEIVEGKYSTNKGSNTTTNNIAASATSVVEIPVIIDNEAVAAASRACVNYALQRGWNSNEATPAWYYALVRLNYILSAYCSGDQQGNWGSLPRCIVQLGNLLKPKKNLPYYGGKISYNFVQIDPVTGFQYLSGPPSNNAYSTYGVYGIHEPSTGAPTIVPPPGGWPGIGPVTDQALQSMFAYCQSHARNAKEAAFWENIPSNTELPDWSQDPSAYAYVANVDGSVSQSTGGYATIVRSEIPCHRPLFAGFAFNSSGVEWARYPGWQHPFAGDILSNMGLYFSQTVRGRALRMKRAPVYKTIDVEEFIDVLAQYVTELLTKASSDPLLQGNQSQIQICSLNYYQLRYMLRYDLMYMFANTQPFVSRLFPQVTSPGHFDFCALQAAAGLFSTTASGARYPQFLIENMRSLTLRVMYNAKGGVSNPVIYVPVLSAPSGSQPNWKDYIYSTFDGTVTTHQAFPDPNGFGNPSIIDGSLGSAQVSMSDSELVSLFANVWNEWLNQLTTYSCPLGNLSTDAGPISLLTTSQQVAGPFLRKELAKQDSKSKLTVGEMARQKLRKASNVPPVWEEIGVVSITSFSPILDSVTPVLYAFIIPVAYLTEANSDPDTHRIGTEQGRTKEMSRITQIGQWGGNFTYSTLGRKHKTFVDYMVKAREAEKSTMEELFMEAEKYGFGGILSNLIGSFAKSILPKEAAGVVDTIADMVPI